MTILRRWQFWLIIGVPVLIVAVVYSFFGRSEIPDDPTEIPLSEVISEAQAGNVQEIRIDRSRLKGFLTDGTELGSRKELDTSMVDVLLNADVKVGGEGGVVLAVEGGGWGNWIGIFITFLPLLFFGGIIIFAVRWAARRP